MANLGMILEAGPTQAAIDDVVYVEITGSASQFSFSNSILVRGYPDTPALRNAIVGTGSGSGAVVIMINDITVHSSKKLSFKVPFEMQNIAGLMNIAGFFIQVWVAGNWAWTLAPLQVTGSGGTVSQPAVYGNLGSILKVSPINSGIGDPVIVEIPLNAQSHMAFTSHVEVRLFPDDPTLLPMIAGSGSVSGQVHIKVTDVRILNPSKLTFTIPQDISWFNQVNSFYIQVDTIYSASTH